MTTGRRRLGCSRRWMRCLAAHRCAAWATRPGGTLLGWPGLKARPIVHPWPCGAASRFVDGLPSQY